jgi:hypothetical protein
MTTRMPIPSASTQPVYCKDNFSFPVALVGFTVRSLSLRESLGELLLQLIHLGAHINIRFTKLTLVLNNTGAGAAHRFVDHTLKDIKFHVDIRFQCIEMNLKLSLA